MTNFFQFSWPIFSNFYDQFFHDQIFPTRAMKGEEPGLPNWFVEDESENQVPMNVNVDPVSWLFY